MASVSSPGSSGPAEGGTAAVELLAAIREHRAEFEAAGVLAGRTCARFRPPRWPR